MYLLPPYNSDSGPGDHWVAFDGESGELLEDPEKPGQSGLVTAMDNTSVGIGDIIAIAVHVKSWDQNCIADLAIGPTVTRSYSFGSVDEGQWRLNPNLPLWQANNSLAPGPFPNQLQPHTLVYQFVVKEEHVALNAIGTWLKLRFSTRGVVASTSTAHGVTY